MGCNLETIQTGQLPFVIHGLSVVKSTPVTTLKTPYPTER